MHALSQPAPMLLGPRTKVATVSLAQGQKTWNWNVIHNAVLLSHTPSTDSSSGFSKGLGTKQRRSILRSMVRPRVRQSFAETFSDTLLQHCHRHVYSGDFWRFDAGHVKDFQFAS